MKIIILILIFLISFLFIDCKEKTHINGKSTMDKFEKFKNKNKFVKGSSPLIMGLSDSTLKPILSEKLNLVADDFKALIESKKTSDKDFQDKIKVGLERFNEYYLQLDTEDREQILHYFEELMDIVELESSNGLLNDWMYGFDPNKK